MTEKSEYYTIYPLLYTAHRVTISHKKYNNVIINIAYFHYFDTAITLCSHLASMTMKCDITLLKVLILPSVFDSIQHLHFSAVGIQYI